MSDADDEFTCRHCGVSLYEPNVGMVSGLVAFYDDHVAIIAHCHECDTEQEVQVNAAPVRLSGKPPARDGDADDS